MVHVITVRSQHCAKWSILKPSHQYSALRTNGHTFTAQQTLGLPNHYGLSVPSCWEQEIKPRLVIKTSRHILMHNSPLLLNQPHYELDCGSEGVHSSLLIFLAVHLLGRPPGPQGIITQALIKSPGSQQIFQGMLLLGA